MFVRGSEALPARSGGGTYCIDSRVGPEGVTCLVWRACRAPANTRPEVTPLRGSLWVNLRAKGFSVRLSSGARAHTSQLVSEHVMSLFLINFEMGSKLDIYLYLFNHH